MKKEYRIIYDDEFYHVQVKRYIFFNLISYWDTIDSYFNLWEAEAEMIKYQSINDPE